MLNTMRVERGSTVAVFGLGCVGLAVIIGCVAVGASRIIAVDINSAKFRCRRAAGEGELCSPVAPCE